MCLRNVPVLLNVLLNASLGQSCSTNHVCDIECWTECPACNVQQKFQAEILLVHQDKEKEKTEVLAADLHEKYALDNVAEDYKK